MEANGSVEKAGALRDCGNQLFKEQRYEDAVGTYREAMLALRDAAEPESEDVRQLCQALRLNLATCLLRLPTASESLSEVVKLCSSSVEMDADSAKALFLRGSAQRAQSEASSEVEEQKNLLQGARRDLLQAARLKPQDRQIRVILDEITEAVKQLSTGHGSGGGLAGCFKGKDGTLNDDRDKAGIVTPAGVVCSTCGREGHPRCGKDLWLEQRAQYLDISLEEAGREPATYEDDGTLMGLKKAQRQSDATTETGGDSGSDSTDMSDEEREMLEDCLESTDKPFPQIKKKLPLQQAIHCAETMWAEDG